MKRTLSLVLALVMVLGTFTGVFADHVEAEVEAGVFLAELGVLKGDLEGDLGLGKDLKRRDAVVMLSRLMDVEEVAANFPGAEEVLKFKDLKDEEGNFVVNDYYASMITWAVTNEYFKGDHENNFHPDNAITLREYLTVLLRALEYGEVSWSEVMAKSVEVGLIEDTSVENEEDFVFTRGTMAVLTVAALETKLNDSDETLAEKLGIEMPEPPTPEVLEVEDVVADNLKEVKVLFNKEVDVDLEDAELFSIKGLTIEEAVMEDNVLVLSIKDKMVNNRDYKLVVKDTDEIDGTYDFKAYDNEVPYVVDVVALGTKAIKVILSEPVQKVTSTNFRLDGKTLYAGVPVSEGKELIIRPYTEMAIGEHDLTVRNLKDHNNFISLESNHKFEVAEDTDAPTVVDVSATLERVVVTFSEDVDPNTVNEKSAYWMEGSVKRYANKATALAGNRYAFDFTTYSLPVYETTLYVEKVADYSGNVMTAAEVPVKAVIDETRPEVVSAELDTNLRTVIVKFSKAVKDGEKDNGARNLDNYRVLDEKDNKILINTITKTNDKEYKVELSSKLSENKNYTIKISGIQDTNKYANTMYDYNGNIAVGVVGLPKITSLSGKYTTSSDENVNEITILFSRAMDLATVVDPANYIVKIDGSVKPLAEVNGYVDVIKGDGSLIKIFVEGEKVKRVTEIAVLGVKDTNDKSLEDYGVMRGLGSGDLAVDREEGILVEAVAVAKDKVEVTFGQPIDKAIEENFKVGGNSVKDVTGHGTKTLTLELSSKLAADIGTAKLDIVPDGEDRVVGVLGTTFYGDDDTTGIAIEDEIRPTWALAEENAVLVDEVYIGEELGAGVKITLKFDENIEDESDLTTAEKTKAVKVVRTEDNKAMTIDLTANDKELYITFTSDVDSAYEVTLVDKSPWIVDKSENTVVGKTVRTTKTDKINEDVLELVKLELESDEFSGGNRQDEVKAKVEAITKKNYITVAVGGVKIVRVEGVEVAQADVTLTLGNVEKIATVNLTGVIN